METIETKLASWREKANNHRPVPRALPALLDAVEAVLALCDEREDELGDLILPDLRALTRDVRTAITKALGVSE